MGWCRASHQRTTNRCVDTPRSAPTLARRPQKGETAPTEATAFSPRHACYIFCWCFFSLPLFLTVLSWKPSPQNVLDLHHIFLGLVDMWVLIITLAFVFPIELTGRCYGNQIWGWLREILQTSPSLHRYSVTNWKIVTPMGCINSGNDFSTSSCPGVYDVGVCNFGEESAKW